MLTTCKMTSWIFSFLLEPVFVESHVWKRPETRQSKRAALWPGWGRGMRERHQCPLWPHKWWLGLFVLAWIFWPAECSSQRRTSDSWGLHRLDKTPINFGEHSLVSLTCCCPLTRFSGPFVIVNILIKYWHQWHRAGCTLWFSGFKTWPAFVADAGD